MTTPSAKIVGVCIHGNLLKSYCPLCHFNGKNELAPTALDIEYLNIADPTIHSAETPKPAPVPMVSAPHAAVMGQHISSIKWDSIKSPPMVRISVDDAERLAVLLLNGKCPTQPADVAAYTRLCDSLTAIQSARTGESNG